MTRRPSLSDLGPKSPNYGVFVLPFAPPFMPAESFIFVAALSIFVAALSILFAAFMAVLSAAVPAAAPVVVPAAGAGVIAGAAVSVAGVDSLVEQAASTTAAKDIEEVVGGEPAFDEQMIGFCRWVADYYQAPLGEVLREQPGIVRAVTGDQRGIGTQCSQDHRILAAMATTAGTSP